MLINYTSRLYYKKFAYKIIVETIAKPSSRWAKTQGKGLMQINAWCQETFQEQNFKIQNRYQKKINHDTICHQLIYVQDASSKDLIIQKFGSRVKQIWQPLNSDHLQQLDIRNLVEVRRELLYKKFRYAVYFRYDGANVIYDWMDQYFKGNSDAKVSGNWRWPRLYLVDDAEITTIRLSWGDAIDYIKIVKLASEG
jgi:hypothetical protein